MMPFDQFREQVEQIPTPYSHPPFLYALVRWLHPRIVVEIGSHIGYSASWMARGLQENGDSGLLYCIDNFCWSNCEQEKLFHTNITRLGVADHIRLIKGRTQEVQWPEKIDMCFIDGNHIYHVVKHDAEKTRDHGAKCIVMHDTVNCEGVRRYTEEMRILPKWSGYDFLESMHEAGLLVCLRKEPKGPIRDYDRDPDGGGQWDKAAWAGA